MCDHKMKRPVVVGKLMIFAYLFTANMRDDIPHLGLEIIAMVSNVYYINLNL